MTTTEHITRDGSPAIKVTCGCKTHPTAAAIITGSAATAIDALTGKARDERVHGFVTMANHPAKMMRVANARKGIFAA